MSQWGRREGGVCVWGGGGYCGGEIARHVVRILQVGWLSCVG